MNQCSCRDLAGSFMTERKRSTNWAVNHWRQPLIFTSWVFSIFIYFYSCVLLLNIKQIWYVLLMLQCPQIQFLIHFYISRICIFILWFSFRGKKNYHTPPMLNRSLPISFSFEVCGKLRLHQSHFGYPSFVRAKIGNFQQTLTSSDQWIQLHFSKYLIYCLKINIFQTLCTPCRYK
jgi:hypothetical protein